MFKVGDKVRIISRLSDNFGKVFTILELESSGSMFFYKLNDGSFGWWSKFELLLDTTVEYEKWFLTMLIGRVLTRDEILLFFPDSLKGTTFHRIIINGNPDNWGSVLDVAVEEIIGLIKDTKEK